MHSLTPKATNNKKTLGSHYTEFRDRFIEYHRMKKLPAQAQKPIYLGLHHSFAKRLVENATRKSKLGFVLDINKDGHFDTVIEQIPGKVKHLIDAQHLTEPVKKLETVHLLQKDILRIKTNIKRQQNFIQKRIKVKVGSSEELTHAKKAFGYLTEDTIKTITGRLDFARNVLGELEAKYLEILRKQ